MNLLTDVLPKAFLIDGAKYPINWDFRTALRIMEIYEDKELALIEQQELMLELLLGTIPQNVERALQLCVTFLNCGEEPPTDEEATETAPSERLFSFSKDANYIFTAINQTHGIDLSNVDDMHWWKFCFLFQDISEDCFFSRLIYLRKQKNADKLTKEEKKWYESIKSIVDIGDDILADDDNSNEFMALLNSEVDNGKD